MSGYLFDLQNTITLILMFEMPDRRAILILGGIAIVGILNALVPNSSAMVKPLELLLAAALIAGGLAFVVIDLREGICINRPSISREESPYLFLCEIFASLFMAGIGISKIWSMF